jgi:hypothetical protein
MGFNITEESAALVAMEGTITVVEEARMAVQSLDVPTQKLAKLVTEGAPSMARRDSGLFSLIADMKCTTYRPFDDKTLLDMPREPECEFPQDDECSYSG